MSKKKIHIDELSKQAYSGFEIPPMPENWDAISNALDKDDKGAFIIDNDNGQKKNRIFPWFKIIASTLFLIGSFALISSLNNLKNSDINIVKNKTINNNNNNNNSGQLDAIKTKEKTNNTDEITILDNNIIKKSEPKLSHSISKFNVTKHKNSEQKFDQVKSQEIPIDKSKDHQIKKLNKRISEKIKINNISRILNNQFTRPIELNKQVPMNHDISIDPSKGIELLDNKTTVKKLTKVGSPKVLKPTFLPFISFGGNIGLVHNNKEHSHSLASELSNKNNLRSNIDFKVGYEYGRLQFYTGFSTNSYSNTSQLKYQNEIFDSFPVLNQMGDTTHWLQKNFRDTSQLGNFNNNMNFINISIGVKYRFNIGTSSSNHLNVGLASELSIPTNFSSFGTNKKGNLIELSKNSLKRINPIINGNIEYNRVLTNQLGFYIGIEHKFSVGNIYIDDIYSEKIRKTMINTGLKIKF